MRITILSVAVFGCLYAMENLGGPVKEPRSRSSERRKSLEAASGRRKSSERSPSKEGLRSSTEKSIASTLKALEANANLPRHIDLLPPPYEASNGLLKSGAKKGGRKSSSSSSSKSSLNGVKKNKGVFATYFKKLNKLLGLKRKSSSKKNKRRHGKRLAQKGVHLRSSSKSSSTSSSKPSSNASSKSKKAKKAKRNRRIIKIIIALLFITVFILAISSIVCKLMCRRHKYYLPKNPEKWCRKIHTSADDSCVFKNSHK
jgi:hypothetical protein